MSANDVMRNRVKRQTSKACCDKRYFVVTYESNDPEAQGRQQDVLNYGNNMTVTVLPSGTFTLDGYRFRWWNTKQDGSGTTFYPGDTFTIVADTYLYAQWEPSFRVVYDKNNVNATGGQVDSTLYYVGDTVTVLDKGTIYSMVFGYVFLNWIDGEGIVYNAGGTFILSGPTTLYAQYTYSPATYDPSGLPSDYFVPMRRNASATATAITVFNASSVATHTISLSAKILNTGFLVFDQSDFFYDGAASRQTNSTVARTPDFSTYVASSITALSTIYNGDDTTSFTSGYFGSNDVILTKYDTTKNAEWVASIHSPTGDETIKGLVTDPLNNVYIFGQHFGVPLTAYDKNGVAYSITVDATVGQNLNSFLVKYSPAGAVLAVASVVGVSNQQIFNVKVTSTNVYITARTSGSNVPVFVNGTFSYTLTGIGTTGSQTVVLKLPPLDNFSGPLWYAKVASNGAEAAYEIDVDSVGNVYGVFSTDNGTSIDYYDAGNTTIVTKTAVNTIPTSRLTAVAKYNSSGIVQWVAAINGANTIFESQQLRVDASGNSYVLVRSQTSMVVTDSAAVDNPLNLPSTFTDVNFLIKISPSGLYVDHAIITQSIVHKINYVNNSLYVDYAYTTGQTAVFYGTSSRLNVGDSTKLVGNMLLKFNLALVPSVVGFCAK